MLGIPRCGFFFFIVFLGTGRENISALVHAGCCLLPLSREGWKFVVLGLVLIKILFLLWGINIQCSVGLGYFPVQLCFQLWFPFSFRFYIKNLYNDDSGCKKMEVVELDCGGLDVRHLLWWHTYVIFLSCCTCKACYLTVIFLAGFPVSCFCSREFLSLLSPPGARKCPNFVFSWHTPVTLYFIKEDTWQGSLA